MIQMGTNFKVVDNSGARWAKCIKVLGKGNKKIATVGSVVLITLNKFNSRKKVKKRTIYVGLIVAIVSWIYRVDGIFIKFFLNRVLVFNKLYKFLGTRIYGVVSKEIRNLILINKREGKYFQKIISYSSLIV